MATKTVNTNQLTPGEYIHVRGRVDYSRITSQIAGEELRRSNERGKQYGRNPIDSPHTKMDLKMADVVYKNPNAVTLEETFIRERMFTRKKHPEYGWCFSAYNKGKYLPWVGVLQPDGSVRELEADEIKGELDANLDITVVLRVFKASPNNGISMDGIIVNEPIRFYKGSNASMLEAAGIIFHPAQNGNARREATPPQPNTDTTNNEPVPQGMNYNQSMTQQAGVPINPPVNDPFTSNAGYNGYNNQQVYQPAYQNANTYQNATPAQPPQQQPAFTGMNAPVDNTNNQTGGIRYTDVPNPQNRNYGG